MSSLTMVVTLLLGQIDSNGLQTDAERAKVQYARWQQYYSGVAAEYEMEVGKDSPTPLRLYPKPVFAYANPAGGRNTHGAIFVWTHEGRPEIFGTIWSRQVEEDRSGVHSMHSLSLEPLKATRNRKLFWAPTGPGIEPWIIPDAPESAASAPLRLAQMRTIVKDFSASTVRGAKENRLEIRPQPAYRWDPATIDRDGAVFVWFEDWDPELLMVIETWPTDKGPRWHAGFARLTNRPVSARHRDTQVWSFAESPEEGPYGGFDQRYISVHRVDVLPAIWGDIKEVTTH